MRFLSQRHVQRVVVNELCSDILKMDIEYAEFNALSSLNGHTQAEKSEFPIGQLLVEFHLFQHQPLTLPIFLDWWESIEYRGLRPTWSEPNLLATSMGMEDRNARLAEVRADKADAVGKRLMMTSTRWSTC